MRCLKPVRRPGSTALSRHIPVSAFSTTVGDHVALESGLEHDLLRRLDWAPDVCWLVAQPVRLIFDEGPERRGHTPDLLSLTSTGEVTLWDVRAVDKQGARFAHQVEQTRRACALVGWSFQVFTGLPGQERLNLLWLSGFRRRPPWASRYENVIREVAGRDGATVGDAFALDDGSGEVKAAVWHLIWARVLAVDVSRRLDAQAPLSVSGTNA